MRCWRSWFLSCLIHASATKTDIIRMTQGSLEKKQWARQSAVAVIVLQPSAEPEDSPLGEKERNGGCLQHPGLSLGCPRDLFLAPLTKL